MTSAELFHSFLNSLGIMSLLGLGYGILIRRGLGPRITCALAGCLFGFGAVFSMWQPIMMADGLFVDLRTLFVGSAGAFLGPIGACIAALLAIGARVMKGGVGMYAGIGTILIAWAMGFLWARVVRTDRADLPRLLLLGVMISASLSAWFLLPGPARNALLSEPAVFVAAFNAIGAVIFGAVIDRERQLSKRETRLFNEAGTDALTGLLNRRSLQDRFIPIGEASSGKALLVIDLDHFKAINDSFGHAVGDEILRMVAQVLRRTVRSGDLVARMGGEEFVVVLADTSREAARSAADRIRAEIEAACLSADLPELTVTTSVGGFWADGRISLDTGLRLADAALYEAKAMGRNTVKFSQKQALAA
ncbi:GGDEF domain-containing protein [Agaricicola taiwanensis]|uniref:diguanylate cyclase n=1 Tax=Agaricicola taiwanensis TaxID=591372 RepID=A0A8J2YMX8_9RHOB|nr:diguanylate cyclase [Agaricicola taiwanensis]GGE54057.1 GGDEF domain-containing protein [Agaricicola taiwanensis]